MIGIKLHKWLFSLTLIISLVSFSGIEHEQVKPVNTITEVVEHNNVPTSAYHVSLGKQNITHISITYYCFNFKAFIQTQNGIFCQKEKAQNLVVLALKDDLNTSYLKRVPVSNTGYYRFTFIG